MARPRIVALALLGLCLALAAPGPAAAAPGRAPAPSRYRGHTAQGFPLRLRVAGSRIWLIRVKVKLRCRDGGLLYDDLSDFEASRLRAGGRFADVQFGPTDEVRWRGRRSERGVRGSLRVKDRLSDGVRCDSGVVGFAVRPLTG